MKLVLQECVSAELQQHVLQTQQLQLVTYQTTCAFVELQELIQLGVLYRGKHVTQEFVNVEQQIHVRIMNLVQLVTREIISVFVEQELQHAHLLRPVNQDHVCAERPPDVRRVKHATLTPIRVHNSS